MACKDRAHVLGWCSSSSEEALFPSFSSLSKIRRFLMAFLEVVIERSIIKLERQLGQQSGCSGVMKTWG